MILFEETWSRLCPEKRFCGLTLEELRTLIGPALKAREEIEDLVLRAEHGFLEKIRHDVRVEHGSVRRIHLRLSLGGGG
jgi:hypothetical protein